MKQILSSILLAIGFSSCENASTGKPIVASGQYSIDYRSYFPHITGGDRSVFFIPSHCKVVTNIEDGRGITTGSTNIHIYKNN